jgi:hypothetical protein
MNGDDVIPFRLAREIVPGPLRPYRIRWMKFAIYAAPFLWIFGTPLIAAAAILLCLAIGQEWVLKSGPALLTLTLVPFVTLFALTIIATKKFPRAIDRELRGRLQTVKLSELLPLRPILFLRCFENDELVSPGESSALTTRDRIEERVVAAAERVAPVVALGRPGEDLPHVGAHRFYVVDHDWQAAVRFVLSRCRHVIVVYHAGPNVQWEVQQAFETVSLERLVFIIPMPKRGLRFLQRLSQDGRDDRERLSHASETFRRYTGYPLPDISKRTEIVVFKDGTPVFLDRRRATSFKGMVWTYGVAVGLLILLAVAVLITYMRAGTGFVAALAGSNVLTMGTVYLVVISCVMLAVFERSRFGSYTKMLEKHFGQE